MKSTSTFSEEPLSVLDAPTSSGEFTALVVVWSRDEPARVGEILLVPAESGGRTWTFGRGDLSPQQGPERLKLVRQRPGRLEPAGPLQCPRISRNQLQIRVTSQGALEIGNIGRCPLLYRGQRQDRVELYPGELLELRNELQLLCVRRPGLMPTFPDDHPLDAFPFGEVDSLGLVGESAPCWELRRQIAIIAGQSAHVLIVGASGTGKELVARAIHARSSRHRRPQISRNAATFPEGLIDAELFGNMRNYPNPGMPERPGLVGEADGTSLFLDEFAELPINLQAHLLRVMDEGEYQRLGESTARRSTFRLIAATNRAERHLKHDIRARLKTRIRVPDLNARREDIPFLVRHLLRRQAQGDPAVARRYFRDGDARSEPRITPALMSALVQHHYRTHVRELEGLLMRAMMDSRGRYLDLGEELRLELDRSVVDHAVSSHQTPGARPVTGKHQSSDHAPLSASSRLFDASPAVDEASSGTAESSDRARMPAVKGSSAADTRVKAPESSAPGILKRAPLLAAAVEEEPQMPGGVPDPPCASDPSPVVLVLPPGLNYERIQTLCEDAIGAYIMRAFLESDGKLFRTAKRLGCNRDVVRRYVERYRKERLDQAPGKEDDSHSASNDNIPGQEPPGQRPRRG